jgi:hypothetical protein
MAGKNGGARPRAGRKPKATKYELNVTQAEDKIVDHLPQILDNLLKLANGGFEVVENKWIPRSAFSLGDLLSGVNSEDAEKAKLKPDERVLAESKTYFALPDRAANIYLIDRILGKPTQKQDIDLTAKGIQITVRHVTHVPRD